MIKYSLKRLARSMLTIVIILTVLFAMLQVMPIEGYFNNFDKLSQQQIDQGLRELGLKDPLYVQVGRFLLNLFKGDLGVSHRYRENVPITTILASVNTTSAVILAVLVEVLESVSSANFFPSVSEATGTLYHCSP